MVHAIESVVIEWSHQIRDVLRRNSAQPLLEDKNPGPLVEIDFWKARMIDLESVVDQLYEDKAQKMTMLLEKTESSYYTAFKNMVSILSVHVHTLESEHTSVHTHTVYM